MNGRGFSVLLAIIFALVALVTCLLVLVVLLMVSRQGSLTAWLTKSTPVIIIPTAAPQPTVNFQPTLMIPLPTVPSVLLPTKDASLSLATRIVVVITPNTGALSPTAPLPAPVFTRALPTSTPGPSPTPTYPSNIRFLPDGPVQPDTSRGCAGGSVYGTIRDMEGKPLAGIKVKVYNEYVTGYSAPSKPVSATDAGFYDFIVNPKPNAWKVVVVDGGNNPISPEVDVVRQGGADVCFFKVDWKAIR